MIAQGLLMHQDNLLCPLLEAIPPVSWLTHTTLWQSAPLSMGWGWALS